MSNIVLIGFMGCGKTTFGKWIANNYNMEFIDTDDYIESKENRKISDIFARLVSRLLKNSSPSLANISLIFLFSLLSI